ncbi:MAG: hypothetical protein OSB47_11335 [Pirellulaceae bacterium]|nr:hypothetical protein [Pirellulaceae bacterium]
MANQESTSHPKRRSLLTIDRIIIYLLLLIFLVLVINDRRILKKATYLNDLIQDASLSGSNNPTPTLDKLDEADRQELVKAVADQPLLRNWFKDHYGLNHMDFLGSDFYRMNSGIRTYRLTIRFQTVSDKKAAGLTELETYYFWEKPATSYQKN